MPSKQVADREKSVELVGSSSTKNEELLAQKLSEIMGIPPETTRTFLRSSRDKMRSTMAATVAADHAHLAELTDDAPPRKARDQAAVELQQALVNLRETVTTAFGDAAVRALGFNGRLPVDQVLLRSHGQLVSNQLEAWTPPEQSMLEGYVFSKEAWSAKLKAPLDRLTAALTAVADEKREADLTLVAKNRAVEESDRAFTLTASVLSALLEAVGEDELARRVRPSRRRPGQISGESDSEVNSTPEPAPSAEDRD